MVKLLPTTAEQMFEDARRSFPDECCGFLFGKDEGGTRYLTHILVVDNAKEGDKRRRFAISTKDYLRAEHFADEHGLSLLSVYHSHPNRPAIPSEHDRVAAQPFFSYLIVSVHDGEIDHLRSWRLNDQAQFEEEKLDENAGWAIVKNQQTKSTTAK